MLLVLLIASGIVVSLLDVIIRDFAHIEMEHVYNVTEYRMSGSGGLNTTGWMIHGIAAIFGPFPNFTRMVQYGIYHSSGLLLKCILNLFAFTGVVFAIKRFDYRYYPLVLYLLMGIFMLLGSGTSLDMRYHVTFLPALIILAAYSLNTVRIKNIVLWGYCALSCVVIALYNLR